ncbi:MAG TPA: hypothetical protein VFA75_20850 [Nevskia sp.]|jgi:hypothetical protein|nr:hypothetical protein [Nevskia sp.]
MTLNITDLTRKVAILDLFRQCHADRAGAPVLLTVLMVAWNESGLRADDLSVGLNEMLEAGTVSLDADPKSPSVALTPAGMAWIDQLDPHVRQEQERILRSLRLRAANKPPEKLTPGQEPRWRIIDRRLQLD